MLLLAVSSSFVSQCEEVLRLLYHWRGQVVFTCGSLIDIVYLEIIDICEIDNSLHLHAIFVSHLEVVKYKRQLVVITCGFILIGG